MQLILMRTSAIKSSLEQQNGLLVAAMDAALHKMLLAHHKASDSPEDAWRGIHQAEDIIRKALREVRQ